MNKNVLLTVAVCAAAAMLGYDISHESKYQMLWIGTELCSLFFLVEYIYRKDECNSQNSR